MIFAQSFRECQGSRRSNAPQNDPVKVMDHGFLNGLMLRSILWSVAVMLWITPSWADEGDPFSFPQFKSGFGSAFAQKDEPAMTRLVQDHPELVRPLCSVQRS